MGVIPTIYRDEVVTYLRSDWIDGAKGATDEGQLGSTSRHCMFFAKSIHLYFSQICSAEPLFLPIQEKDAPKRTSRRPAPSQRASLCRCPSRPRRKHRGARRRAPAWSWPIPLAVVGQRRRAPAGWEQLTPTTPAGSPLPSQLGGRGATWAASKRSRCPRWSQRPLGPRFAPREKKTSQ